MDKGGGKEKGGREVKLAKKIIKGGREVKLLSVREVDGLVPVSPPDHGII